FGSGNRRNTPESALSCSCTNSPRRMKLVNCRPAYHHNPMPPSPVATPLLTTNPPAPHWRHCFKPASENRDSNPFGSDPTSFPLTARNRSMNAAAATTVTKRRRINCLSLRSLKPALVPSPGQQLSPGLPLRSFAKEGVRVSVLRLPNFYLTEETEPPSPL